MSVPTTPELAALRAHSASRRREGLPRAGGAGVGTDDQQRLRLGAALTARLPDVSARIPWELLVATDVPEADVHGVWNERWESVAIAARRIAEQVVVAVPGGGARTETLQGLVRQSATGRLPLAMLVQLTLWLRDAASSVLAEEATRLALSGHVLEQACDRVARACEELLIELAGRVDEDLARADGRLAYLAAHDELTGLATRAVCLTHLETALPSARARSKVGVLCVDVDGFAALNDAFGAQTCDELLTQTARRLRASLRAGDLVGRTGSDEFLVICCGLRSLEAVRRAGTRLQETLSAPFVLPGRQVRMSISVGAALARASETAGQLVGRAEAALHVAQSRGSGQLQMAGDRGGGAKMRQTARLAEALAHEELFVRYQPVVEVASGRTSAVEALLRWRPTGGELVAPADFIPLAEASGSIVPIGQWVLTTACQQAQHLTARAGRPIQMAVNVSVRQLSEPTFVDVVRSALHASGLEPGFLTLELTESLFAGADTERVLQRLKELGVQLSIDDFGTGFSSLSYLRRFAIDTVKLDRSLLPASADAAEQVLFAGSVHLAHQLGMRVVAEGVETTSQLDAVRSAGCDHVQGYLFGRAQDPAQLSASELNLLHCRGPG